MRYVCVLGIKLIVVVYVAFYIFAPVKVMAEPANQFEEEVKAAFVFNILKFVEWPDIISKDKTINLCIVGNSPMVNYLRSLEGKDIKGGHTLKVMLHDELTGSIKCHAVLINAKNKDEDLKQILQKLQSQSVLTISDKEGFINQGGIIELLKQNNKIRFNVNMSVANESRLKISSKLLKLAQEVKQ